MTDLTYDRRTFVTVAGAAVLGMAKPPPKKSYLLQEDGTGHFELENGHGDLLMERP